MTYTETYQNLSHGTDEYSASKIKEEGFKPSTSLNSWCGEGVYFYDIKKKAWWSAKRRCYDLYKQTKQKLQPTVIFADIIDIPTTNIFDLRIYEDLSAFEKGIEEIWSDCSFVLSGIEDETERIIRLRAMLISFYADTGDFKLVIGNFRQRPQPKYEHAIEFSNSLDMIFGIETIYCVKDTSIISNIH